MLQPNVIGNPDAETNVTGWSGGNCTIARNTTQFHSGVACFSMTATAAGNALATYTTAFVGTPGQRVTISCWFRSAATARSALVQIDWKNSTGGYQSTSGSTTITTTTTGWTQSTSTITAPSASYGGTVYPQIVSAAASEVHYFDDISVQVNWVNRRIGNRR